jgi:hypothetical protein
LYGVDKDSAARSLVWTGKRTPLQASQILGEASTSSMAVDDASDASSATESASTSNTAATRERLFSAGLNGQIIEWDLVNMKIKVCAQPARPVTHTSIMT